MFPMLDSQLLQPTQIGRHSNSNPTPTTTTNNNSSKAGETSSSAFPVGTSSEAALLVLPTTAGTLDQLEMDSSAYRRSPLSCLVTPVSSTAVMQYNTQRPSVYSFNQHISSWMAGLPPPPLPQHLLSSPVGCVVAAPLGHSVSPTGRRQQQQQQHFPSRRASPVKGEAGGGGQPGKPTKRHTCTDCFKSFHRASDLVKHQRTHTGEKPFVCPHCSRAFSDSSSLSAHKRIHTGERPYRCDECSKAFAVSSSLVKHRRTHTGEKPYRCRVCGRAFSDNSSFAAHKKRNQPCATQQQQQHDDDDDHEAKAGRHYLVSDHHIQRSSCSSSPAAKRPRRPPPLGDPAVATGQLVEDSGRLSMGR